MAADSPTTTASEDDGWFEWIDGSLVSLILASVVIVVVAGLVQVSFGSYSMTIGQAWGAVFSPVVWTHPQVIANFLLGEAAHERSLLRARPLDGSGRPSPARADRLEHPTPQSPRRNRRGIEPRHLGGDLPGRHPERTRQPVHPRGLLGRGTRDPAHASGVLEFLGAPPTDGVARRCGRVPDSLRDRVAERDVARHDWCSRA